MFGNRIRNASHVKALIVFAHPNPRSLNGRMKDQAVRALSTGGHAVEVSDLYAMNFHPVAGPGDFSTLSDPDYFDLQKEQLHAAVHGTFSPDIAREQQKLRRADLMIFQFPFWWYSMPAIVKGYFDRVFSVGFAYGGHFELAGKKVLVSTTTGAGTDWLSETEPPGSVKRIFHHILYGTFAFCKMEVLDPFIVYHAKRLSEEQKRAKLKAWEETLLNIEERGRIF